MSKETNQFNPGLKRNTFFWLTITPTYKYQFCFPNKKKIEKGYWLYVRAVIHRCHQKALSGTQRGVDLYTVYSPPLRNKWFTAYTFIKTRSLIICTILPDRTSSPILLNMLSMNTGAMTSSVVIILLGLSCQLVDASLESEMKKILPMVSKQQS